MTVLACDGSDSGLASSTVAASPVCLGPLNGRVFPVRIVAATVENKGSVFAAMNGV
jgi:hypothetical protein